MEIATQWPNPLHVADGQVIVGDAEHRWAIDVDSGRVLAEEARGKAPQVLADGWTVSGRTANGPAGAKVDGPIVGITRSGSDWWVATRESLHRFGSRPERKAHAKLRALAATPEGVAWVDDGGLTDGTCRLPLGEGTPWLAASARWLVVSGSAGSLVVERASCAVVAARDGRGGRVVVDGEHVWTWDGSRLWRAALPSLAPEPAFTPFVAARELGGASVRGRTVLAPIPWGLPGPAWWLGDRFVGLDAGRLRVWSGEGKLLADVGETGLVEVTGADRLGDRVVVTDGARVVVARDTSMSWTRDAVVTRVRAAPEGVWLEERRLVDGAWTRTTALLTAAAETPGAAEPPPGSAVVSPGGEVVPTAARGFDTPARTAWGLPVVEGSLRCAPILATAGPDTFPWTFERATLVTSAAVSPEKLPPGLDLLQTRPAPERDVSTLAVGGTTAAAVAAACGAILGAESWLVEPGGGARRYRTSDAAVLAHEAAARGWAASLFPPIVASTVLAAAPTTVLAQHDGSVVVGTKAGSARVGVDGTRWRIPGEVRGVDERLVLPIGHGSVRVDVATGQVLRPVAPVEPSTPRAWGWDCTGACVGPSESPVATPIGDGEWLFYDAELILRKGRRSLLRREQVDAVLPLGADRLLVRAGSSSAPWELLDARGALLAVLPAGQLVVAGSTLWIADGRSLTAFATQ